jgi:hypothetical protein
MTADLAVLAMAVVSLASIGRDFAIQMKMADRFRVVSPPKQQQKTSADVAAPVGELSKRRPA